MFLPENAFARVVIAILIHLVVPASGFVVYLLLCRTMREQGVKNPPQVPFFIVFFSYGGWLLVFLTILFWLPSGAMYLGAAYLLLLAPLVMLALAVRLYPQRAWSRYHNAAFVACLTYEALVGAVLLAWAAFIRFGAYNAL